MAIKDRIGIDIGVKKPVEDGLVWASENGLHYVDFRLDIGPGKELPPENLPLTTADEELLSRILPHSKIAARHGKRNVIAA